MGMQKWANQAIEQLVQAGVTNFVICPGSRSAPLVLAAARNEGVNTIIHYDERGACFLALGISKANNRPSAIITTSGTAVANLLPAVVEAHISKVPLILLTADRPVELYNTNANQTIDQNHIFYNFTVYEFNFDAPGPLVNLPNMRSTISYAVAQGIAKRGPVHLNCSFREPLIDHDFSNENYSAQTKYFFSRGIPSFDTLGKIQDLLEDSYLILGEMTTEQIEQLRPLIENTECVVFPDVLSGFRLHSSKNIIAHHELIFKRTQNLTLSKTILHIGGRFLSKSLQTYLEKHFSGDYIHIHSSIDRYDPGSLVTHRVQCDDFSALKEFLLKSKNKDLIDINQNIKANADAILQHLDLALMQTVAEQGLTTFLGNSSTIRFFHDYVTASLDKEKIFGNRGASGIDGSIATSVGLGYALRSPIIAILGDLSFYHDMNSLLLAKRLEVNILIVILNNFGGKIFEHLPIAEEADVFEQYFYAPHEMQFEKAASQFDLDYHKATSTSEIKKHLSFWKNQARPMVLEVIIDKDKEPSLGQTIKKIFGE